MPSKKIGFILPHLGPSQLAYQLITSTNEYLHSKDDVDPCLFYHNLSPIVVKPNFGVFNLLDCFSYNGIVVATNIHSLQRCLTWPGPRRHNIYLYANDLEWIRLQQKQYEQLHSLYCNPLVNIIARSKPHHEIISSCWKTPVGIVENAEFSKFVEICK